MAIQVNVCLCVFNHINPWRKWGTNRGRPHHGWGSGCCWYLPPWRKILSASEPCRSTSCGSDSGRESTEPSAAVWRQVKYRNITVGRLCNSVGLLWSKWCGSLRRTIGQHARTRLDYTALSGFIRSTNNLQIFTTWLQVAQTFLFGTWLLCEERGFGLLCRCLHSHHKVNTA